MLRPVLAFVGLFGAGAFAAPLEPVLRVTVDQARVVEMPKAVATLVIGNPAIADVTRLKAGGGLVVTGRGYGRTNLLALDGAGELVEEREIVVGPPEELLVVQRGAERQSYACDPHCMPAPALGDATSVFGDVAGAIGAHDALAGGRGGGAGESGGGGGGGGAAGRSAVARVIGVE